MQSKKWVKCYFCTIITGIFICFFLACFFYLILQNEGSISGGVYHLFRTYPLSDNQFMVVLLNKPMIVQLDLSFFEKTKNLIADNPLILPNFLKLILNLF